jgi:hypothetical protein
MVCYCISGNVPEIFSHGNGCVSKIRVVVYVLERGKLQRYNTLNHGNGPSLVWNS